MNQQTKQLRAISNADIQVAFNHIAEEAIREFTRKGSVKSKIAVVTMHKKKQAQLQGIHLVAKDVSDALFGGAPVGITVDGFAKELLAEGSEMRAALAKDGVPLADIVAFVREAFMSFPAVGTKLRDVGAPSEAQDRMECVIIEMHTREGSSVGYCWISDNPRRCIKGNIQHNPEQMNNIRLPGGKTVKAVRM